MNKQEGKNMIVPIETEIEKLTRVLSENERKTNPRLMKKMGKIKLKLSLLREAFASKRVKLAGAY